MELLPDDLRRIVFAFSAPTVGARQLAARARTLDEYVEYRRLEDEPASSIEWKTVEQGVAHTRAQLDLLGALRTVSKDWRNLISYGSTRQLTLTSDACLDLPPDFATRFGGCEALTIEGLRRRQRARAPWVTEPREGSDSLPVALQHLEKLRSLSMHRMALHPLPSWFGALPLVELYIDYGTFRGESFRREDGSTITPVNGIHHANPVRAWESDPHVLPRTLEVLYFNVCTEDVALECVRLLPRIRELRIGSRNMKQADDVPYWFDELTSLRRFEVYLAGVDDWSWKLSAMSLESVSFQVDQLVQDEEDFCYDLGTLFLREDSEEEEEEEDDDSAETYDQLALPLTRLGESLREIHLNGYSGRPDLGKTGLTRMPECLLRLPRLEHLDLSGNFDLVELPDSVGQLPLVVLNLSWTGVRTLPASLQTTSTLRVLEVWCSSGLSGPSRHYQTGEVYLSGSPALKLADAAEEIARMDAVLRPLSLAVPELRVLMHSDDEGRTPKGASMRCWHARCGHDWTDPVFY